eukprot:CAMPEP_0197695814 /NCGR_PEP_ID=MMETSP1338-20131121/115720_1 /TAXON_ID=43686 ORGANISM="Pelagodinium beii, Strain RCC1491" /NCGR_SAMPLE_ID=MMETSP1338 /ASSEMBLY_ACC=CAM_ASM_000754 /LENGTH=51 /DNA_ID=CAMNT_0043278851 /DNA_START=1 /DNA_END=152 /DNA_ORIENTATION=+
MSYAARRQSQHAPAEEGMESRAAGRMSYADCRGLQPDMLSASPSSPSQAPG